MAEVFQTEITTLLALERLNNSNNSSSSNKIQEDPVKFKE